jgi:hypothetical protein
MLLKNLDLEAGAGRMLVNGSRGVIIRFRPRAEVTQLWQAGHVPTSIFAVREHMHRSRAV